MTNLKEKQTYSNLGYPNYFVGEIPELILPQVSPLPWQWLPAASEMWFPGSTRFKRFPPQVLHVDAIWCDNIRKPAQMCLKEVGGAANQDTLLVRSGEARFFS